MTTADTIRLRERLLAELRDSPRPLSTTELAARMPWKVERSDDSCALLCGRTTPNPDANVVECHRSWHIVQYRRTAHGYTGIYRHLRSLERQGQIRRTLRDGHKRVCWVYIGADQRAAAQHQQRCATGPGGDADQDRRSTPTAQHQQRCKTTGFGKERNV